MEKNEINVEMFVRKLSECESQECLFNPFKDVCPINDLPNAPTIRCNNLKIFLEAQLRNKPQYLWVAEAPGYKGSRRSGVFLVSEKNFDDISRKISSEMFSIATKTEPQIAISVKIMWSLIRELPEFPLTFNALPFHPFRKDNIFKNRKPKKSEIQKNLHYLKTVIDWFKPKRIIAIGRTAEFALQDLKVDFRSVRHPAQGGETEFINGIKKIYGLN